MIFYKKQAAQHMTWPYRACILGVLFMFSILLLAPLPASAKGAIRGDLDHCSWNRPGADPYMGDVVAAVDRYTDIAPQVREQLKQRMRARQYDEIVVIKRDAIRGKQNYDARISEMHFGEGRVCRDVTRAGWTDRMEERGLVYCVQGECILVPTVCRNVSRITQVSAAAPRAAGGGAPGAGASGPAAAPAATAAPAGVPMIDNPDALRGGSATGGTMPSSDASPPFLSYNGLQVASRSSPPATGGGGGGGGGGNGILPGTDGSSFVIQHPLEPTVILPSTPTSPTVLPAVPEPQTWGMLLAGLALIGCSVLRRRKQS